MINMQICVLILVLSTGPAMAQNRPARALQPSTGTITATPLANGTVTVYSDSRGRTVGTATRLQGGTVIYRGGR